ncbi:MAG TPA: TM2 domain-containing protein [Dongiaceae bacterium]|jgi:TM2 domain-containing membrane protein YozV|nr:TM2 domain-containing protein [Dongiaceae bacterium]
MSYDRPIDHDRDGYNRELIENTVFNARKSGLVAYLLWMFLGGFGMHNFYLGRPQVGALQMFGTLFVYCTYVSEDPWPLVGLIIGVPLGFSLLLDAIKIPARVVACSERLRARLEGDMRDWRGA